jgi:predicted amidohydrolase
MKLPKIPKYKAAAVQFAPKLGEKERNITRQIEMDQEAARNGAKLIVNPEMGCTGYCWYDREEVAPYVETIPGPTTEKFGKVARSLGCWIVTNVAEVEPHTNIFYNSFALLGPDGLIGKYRKVHSFVAEPKWAKGGDLGFPVWETDIGNIAGVICMDGFFVESIKVPALKGADVIVYPTNWLLEKCPCPTWITRAFENGVYFIAADRWDLERTVQFSGGSCILNPDGTIQAHTQEHADVIVYGEIDIAKARDKRFMGGPENKVLDRRPDQYFAFARNPYVWNPFMFFGLYGHRPLPQGKKSKIAAAQFSPVPGKVDDNLKKMESLLQKAGAGVDLVVYPELATTGIIKTKAEAEGLGEDLAKGPTVKKLMELAKKAKTYIATGIAEKADGALYNSAILVGPDGVVGKYRKLHLTSADKTWAQPGNLGLPTFDIPAGRVGLIVGYDAVISEPARCLAIDGCDLICICAALKGPAPVTLGPTKIPFADPIIKGDDPHHWHLGKGRAFDNGTHVAFSNQHGGGMMGLSGIFGYNPWEFPRPEVWASPDKDEVISFTMDTTSLSPDFPSNALRRKDFVGMRQPYWYDAVVDPKPPVLDIL